jgi:hypothetical protein
MHTRFKAGIGVLGALALSLAAAASGATPAAFSVQGSQLSGLGAIRNLQSSLNWSGYAQTTSVYSEVRASWVVPTIARKSGTAFSSQWIGIDGDGNRDLIQTGTQAILADGQKGYGAWWEILPAAETPIDENVKPGDVMTATIAREHNGWHITLQDGKKWTFTVTKHYSGPGASIEWIVEAPEVGDQISAMLDTTPVTFWGEQKNNKTAVLLPKNAIQCVQNHVGVETPSAPNAKSAFTLAYGAKVPAPPG